MFVFQVIRFAFSSVATIMLVVKCLSAYRMLGASFLIVLPDTASYCSRKNASKL